MLDTWWALLIQGIAAIIIGAIVLLTTALSSVVLLQILGWYWLIVGVLRAVGGAGGETRSTQRLVIGGLGIIVGLAAVIYPLWSAIALPTVILVLIGVYGMVEGLWSLYRAYNRKQAILGVLGVLSLALGILLILAPSSPLAILTNTLGLVALLGGIIAVALALLRRSRERTPGDRAL
ncbi:MAG TPA: hypothetical protein GX702_11470 [Chloroflexi bacterium]|nr:hypothetical protein [Chloroflexota bacterium]